ncbi:hypothetical protein LXL04_012786 [Taraxacum kok-saghyz]
MVVIPGFGRMCGVARFRLRADSLGCFILRLVWRLWLVMRVDQSWQLQWIRDVRDGAGAEQLAQLCDLLEEVELSDNPGGWGWSLDGSTEFSVAAVRCHLDGSRLPGGSSPTSCTTNKITFRGT